MQASSDRQQAILKFITERIRQDGYPPSVREIGAAVGLKSPSTVHAHLKSLKAMGYIEDDGPNRKRAIRLLNVSPAQDENLVPLVGRVAAGIPILATEQIEDYIPFKNQSGVQLFALRVQGESMIDAAILDGDIVVVEKTPVAENGQIVVALLEEEATVKRFYREKNGFRLQPENASMAPIYTDSLLILGRVIACLRYY